MVITTGNCCSLLEQEKKSRYPALKDQVRKAAIHRAENDCMNDCINQSINKYDQESLSLISKWLSNRGIWKKYQYTSTIAFICQNQAVPDQSNLLPYQNGNSGICYLLFRTSGQNRIISFCKNYIDIDIYSFKIYSIERLPCNASCGTLLLEPNVSRSKTFPEKLVSAFLSKKKYALHI